MLAEVHLKAADSDQLLLFRRAAAAAQHRTDARGHLHHAERLCKIVVRAEVKADDLVVLVALGRRHDDRDVGRARVGFQALEDGYAVLARQHDVEHYQLRHSVGQGRVKLLCVFKAHRPESRGVERIYHQIADACVVFNTKYHCHYLALP